jgi:hypothetical protein
MSLGKNMQNIILASGGNLVIFEVPETHRHSSKG